MKHATTYNKGRRKGKAYVRNNYHIYMISKDSKMKLEKAKKDGDPFYLLELGYGEKIESQFAGVILVTPSECICSDELEPLLDEYMIRNEDGTYDFASRWYPGCKRMPAGFDANAKYDWAKLDLAGAIWTPYGLCFVARLKNGELRLETGIDRM